MVTYDYATLSDDVASLEELEEAMDELGGQGFKLIAVDRGTIYMMRERGEV